MFGQRDLHARRRSCYNHNVYILDAEKTMAHIVIVEESSSRLSQLQTALRGHRLVCTGNVDRALNAVKANQFDLLIAPVYLSSADVFHLVRTAAEIDRRVRIVLYTTEKAKTARYATTAIRAAAEFLGVYRYLLLEDPSNEELRKALEECIPVESWARLSSESGRIYEI